MKKVLNLFLVFALFSGLFILPSCGGNNGGENEPKVDAVQLTPSPSTNGFVGTSIKFTVAPNTGLTWTSSNEAVATVSENGVATLHSKGQANITATHTASNVSATCQITATDLYEQIAETLVVYVPDTITLNPYLFISDGLQYDDNTLYDLKYNDTITYKVHKCPLKFVIMSPVGLIIPMQATMYRADSIDNVTYKLKSDMIFYRGMYTIGKNENNDIRKVEPGEFGPFATFKNAYATYLDSVNKGLSPKISSNPYFNGIGGRDLSNLYSRKAYANFINNGYYPMFGIVESGEFAIGYSSQYIDINVKCLSMDVKGRGFINPGLYVDMVVNGKDTTYQIDATQTDYITKSYNYKYGTRPSSSSSRRVARVENTTQELIKMTVPEFKALIKKNNAAIPDKFKKFLNPKH